MPKQLAISREIVKALFMQGFSQAQIKEKTGLRPSTLQTWVNRYNWQAEKREVKAMAETMPTAKGALSIREQASILLAHDLHNITKASVRSPKGAYARQKSFEPWVRNAKVVLGWNESTQNTLVSISVLSSNTPTELTPTNPSNELPLSSANSLIELTPDPLSLDPSPLATPLPSSSANSLATPILPSPEDGK